MQVKFPEKGSYHDGQNQRIIEHLVKTKRGYVGHSIITNNSKIAWNKNEYWVFSEKSKYQKYSYGELVHFIAHDVANAKLSSNISTAEIEKKTDKTIINGTSIENGWRTYPQFINTTNSWIPVEQRMSPSYAGINFVDYMPAQWQLPDSIMSIDLTIQPKDKIETNLITLKCVHTKKLLRITI